MVFRLFLLFILTSIFSCQSDDAISPDTITPIYFPEPNSDDWETISPNQLSWNLEKLEELEEFLASENTKSFMVLVKGKIVLEEYYNGHTADDLWQWNSAGKTLVTATVGIAQQSGLIDIDHKVSDYIGTGWTSTTIEKEDLIKIKNLLNMTSGLDDQPQLVIPKILTYLDDAGDRWAYGNVFQRLMNVIEEVNKQPFENYFNNELGDIIGMEGFWNNGLIYRIYNSTTRSMARFGLLASQNGNWNGKQIINEQFFVESTRSSQDLNPSYGYLWWLNGKSKYMLPSTQTEFFGELVPDAPADMIAAMGKDEQRLYIVPSKNLVIVRMGEAAESSDSFALSSFDNTFWQIFNEVVD